MNGTESERLRRAVERLMDGQREALEVLRRALDGEAPAEGAFEDLEDILQGAQEDARAILGMEEENGRTGRDRPRPEPPFAPVLTARTEGDESSAEMGDNDPVRTSVFGGAKEARGAAASPFRAPAAPPPSVVLRFFFHPDLATDGT